MVGKEHTKIMELSILKNLYKDRVLLWNNI
jgi:hypothetical protein